MSYLVKEFKKYEFQIDDQFKNGNLGLGFVIYIYYRERVKEREKYVHELLSKKLDFNKDEFYTIDRADSEWPNSEQEMNNLWRKKIKNQILVQQLSEENQDKVYENIEKAHTNRTNIIWQTKPEEVFELFLNAFTKEFGPHTQYMSRTTAENFRIQMSLSLEGIGATLQNDNSYTIVRKIVGGGPADKAGELKADDKIIGVGQTKDSIEDVTGWRLMDVVSQIRGKKGTTVYLKRFIDGDISSKPDVISIVRDVIQLQDSAAKIEYQKVKDRTFAVIELPLFYANYKDKSKGLTTSSDVKKLLLNAQKEHDIDGVIIDLRGNGGGYLPEAINLTGLFIDKGPVVQVQSKDESADIYRDTKSGTVFDGPLAVLVDQNSASASEIFAAAIQDYGRGIVIGERTFGKGTVQEVKPLTRPQKNKASSTLKFTTQQFFRINGESTQVRGVTPDIELDIGNRGGYGEGKLDKALPWSQIDEAKYNHRKVPGILALHEMHLSRSSKSPAFKFLKANSKLQENSSNVKVVHLNKSKRQEWNNSLEKNRLNIINEYRKALRLKPVNKDTIKDSNKDLPDEDKHWDRIYQKESALILNDFLDINEVPNFITQR